MKAGIFTRLLLITSLTLISYGTAWSAQISTADAKASQSIADFCLSKLRRANAVLPTGFDPAKPTVVIVDAYSSGRFFASEFRNANFQVIHIHAHGEPPKDSFRRTFWGETFDLDIAYRGDQQALEAQLKDINIVAVVPGADSGVLFADGLSTLLARRNNLIPYNGVDRARKDKYLMAERLRELGIDAVQQMKTQKVDEAIAWVRSNKYLERGPKKVVIKPLLSGGSDGLFFAQTEEEIHKAFEEILGKPDESGNMNNEVLVQEFLEGDEYVVNTVGRDGIHVITDMWKYAKRYTPDGHRLVYDFDELIPFEGDLQRQLIEYNDKVLRALGIRTGNGHSEIKMVPGRGPVLVEMNTRPMGSSQPVLTHLALGHSQIDLSVLAYAKPQEFVNVPRGYEMKNYAMVMTLANFKGPKARLNPQAIDLIKSLPGYTYHSIPYGPGQTLKPTIDLGSAIGDIWLVHPDRNVLLKTIERLHRMEQDGSLVLDPD